MTCEQLQIPNRASCLRAQGPSSLCSSRSTPPGALFCGSTNKKSTACREQWLFLFATEALFFLAFCIHAQDAGNGKTSSQQRACALHSARGGRPRAAVCAPVETWIPRVCTPQVQWCSRGGCCAPVISAASFSDCSYVLAHTCLNPEGHILQAEEKTAVFENS